MKIKYVFILFFSILLVGCSSTRFVVDVSSIQHEKAGNKVFIAPGMKDVNINNLQFKEYSAYIIKALQKKGFTVVDNIDDADQVIMLAYGVSNPQTYTRNTHPVST